jgi:hypothetical protein
MHQEHVPATHMPNGHVSRTARQLRRRRSLFDRLSPADCVDGQTRYSTRTPTGRDAHVACQSGSIAYDGPSPAIGAASFRCRTTDPCFRATRCRTNGWFRSGINVARSTLVTGSSCVPPHSPPTTNRLPVRVAVRVLVTSSPRGLLPGGRLDAEVREQLSGAGRAWISSRPISRQRAQVASLRHGCLSASPRREQERTR